MIACRPTSMGITLKQHRREEEHDQDISQIKMHMDLLIKHLLSGKVEKLNAVGS